MVDMEILEAFASTFIRPAFRDRFAHEAAKKLGKLLDRVCHNAGELFEAALVNGSCSYESFESCFILSDARGFKAATWAEACRVMGLGDGLLVIGADGAKFYAETEASRSAPSVVFAGAVSQPASTFVQKFSA
jgi:hypothetical protein